MREALPKGWEDAPFGDVANIVTGTTPSKTHPEFYGGDIPFITPAELNGLPVVSNAPTTLSLQGVAQARLLPKDSVMVSCIGTLGKVAIAGCPLVTNQQINALVFDENKIFPVYGYYYCLTIRRELEKLSSSTTIPIVNKSRFAELRISFPTLPEQKRIAAILDKADAIRRKRQQAMQLADEFLRSVFLDMVGDPSANPKGWPFKELRDFVYEKDKINYGVVQPGSDYTNGIPLIRVGDMLNGFIDRRKLKIIDPAIEKKYGKSRLVGDEILVACVGSVGKVALVDPSLANCNVARAVARIRPGRNIIREYLFKFLDTPFVQRFFLRETRTVSQPTLNINLIERTPILVPPKELQKRFRDIYNAVMGMVARQEELKEQENHLFQSVTQRAFRGGL